jgi:hypothetical protein
MVIATAGCPAGDGPIHIESQQVDAQYSVAQTVPGSALTYINLLKTLAGD